MYSTRNPNQYRCVVAFGSGRRCEALGTHVGLVNVLHQETETQTSKKRAIELEHKFALGIGFLIVVATIRIWSGCTYARDAAALTNPR